MNRILKSSLIIFVAALFHVQVSASADDLNEGRKIDPDSKAMIGAEEKQEKIAEAFQKGYALYENKNYHEACPYFYTCLRNSSPDDTDYEWAEFFFGICLKKSGFSHASTDVLAHLVTRKPNPKIVSYCLELFEKTIRTIPFDRDLVINKVICDQEYDFVEEDLADFINFYQGVYDWKHGFSKWGDEHFSRIRPGTYYFYRYRYHQALKKIYGNQIDDAIPILREIMESPFKNEKFKDEVRETLARLLYEKGDYALADRLYGEIQKNILEQSQNFLERAWAHYRIGNPEKAMGFLYAFKAPSFQNHFTPEYYILKSFIFKDVCHYKRALEVVSSFNQKYGSTLKSIYHRGNPEENYTMMLVLLNKGNINEIWKFLELLEMEKTKLKTFQDKDLKKYLEKIYLLQIEESTDNLKKTIQEEYENMANQLLRYEEEAHLMEYEISIDMAQRVYQNHYNEESSEKENASGGIVVYPFQGEFWNDELADYTVELPNKCNNTEEWDIFSK
jgi:hypothetical protein